MGPVLKSAINVWGLQRINIGPVGDIYIILCFRDNNGGDDVGPDSSAAEAGEDDPGQAHQSGVNVEVLGNSAADTAQHTVYR